MEPDIATELVFEALLPNLKTNQGVTLPYTTHNLTDSSVPYSRPLRHCLWASA